MAYCSGMPEKFSFLFLVAVMQRGKLGADYCKFTVEQ